MNGWMKKMMMGGWMGEIHGLTDEVVGRESTHHYYQHHTNVALLSCWQTYHVTTGVHFVACRFGNMCTVLERARQCG